MKEGESNKVTIFEMAPRDGLQSLWNKDTSTEKDIIPVKDKMNLIKGALLAGVRKIEVGAFVHPKYVPQMANTKGVIEKVLGLEHVPDDVKFAVLVPNVKGMQAALDAGVNSKNFEVAIFTSASEAFEQNNLNRSISESLQSYKPVMELAKEHNIPVRGYVSAFCGCPITGEPVETSKIIDVTKALLDMGVYEVSLGDTTGIGNPEQVKEILSEMKKAGIDMGRLAGHFHDTYGKGVVNSIAAAEMGIRTLDGSAGGLGGCPFAVGAKGNVATEELVIALHEKGFDTGIDAKKLMRGAAKGILDAVGDCGSKTYQKYMEELSRQKK